MVISKKKRSSLKSSLLIFNFHPKIKVFSKKKRSSLKFSLLIFNFYPKIKVFSKKKKKKGLHLNLLYTDVFAALYLKNIQIAD